MQSIPTENPRGLTVRTFLIGVGLLFLSILWIRDVELISFTCQISESTPPMPAIAVALLLGLMLPMLKRLGWKGLTRQEQSVLYVFVAIGSLMSAVGVAQAILPYMTVLDYFASPENVFGEMRDAVPDWVGPRDGEVVRTFFEGSEGGKVPWAHWAKPLGIWTLFLCTYWVTTLCIWTIFRRQWADTERLSFPLLHIPVNMMGGAEGKEKERSFVKDPLMWTGFGLAFIYNLLNILQAFNPSVAAVGVYYPIGNLFTEKPLNALQWVQMWYRPELVGLGYLMAQDVLQTVWGFFLIQRAAAVFANATGTLRGGFPYEGEQGLGGYFVMGLFLLWSAREHIRRVLGKALGRNTLDDSDEPIPYRWAVIGLITGFIGLVSFASLVGVHPVVSVIFFVILMTFVFVYARIRAETGMPSVWVMSHGLINQLIFYVFGSDTLRIGGSIRTMSALSHFFFLCHAGFFGQTTVYQFESFKLSDEVGGRRKEMVWVGLLALFIGLGMAYWMFMTTYYQFGTNVLAGGAQSGTGGGRVQFCLQAFRQVAHYVEHPRTFDRSRDMALGVGAGITLLLVLGRMIHLRFPLHPLGYIMTCIWGGQLWWAFFVAWAAKKMVLHLGGVQLYRRLIPMFLGLALGHFFTMGILWGSIAKLWPHVTLVIWFV